MFTSDGHDPTLHRYSSIMVGITVAGLCLIGCQGTLHDRRALRRDSVDDWALQMASLPIEVHGRVPGTDFVQTIARIPNGTAARAGATPRIVLYVGDRILPLDTGYCDASPTLRAVTGSADRVVLGVALCDGATLVAAARQDLTPGDLSESSMGASIEELKYRLTVALSPARRPMPPAQRPMPAEVSG